MIISDLVVKSNGMWFNTNLDDYTTNENQTAESVFVEL
jgi:hypothetical protein